MAKKEISKVYSVEVNDNDLDGFACYDYAIRVELNREDGTVIVQKRLNTGNGEIPFGHPDSLDTFADELKAVAVEMRKWPQFKSTGKSK